MTNPEDKKQFDENNTPQAERRFTQPLPVHAPIKEHRPEDPRFYPYACWASWYAYKLWLMRRLGFVK